MFPHRRLPRHHFSCRDLIVVNAHFHATVSFFGNTTCGTSFYVWPYIGLFILVRGVIRRV